MRQAVIAGVGMTRFGKHIDTGMKALGREAVEAALDNAGVEGGAIEAAYVGNAMAGLVTGQECIRGQVVLRSAGIGQIPVVNVENACASGSTAFHQADAMVRAGVYDVVLALGVEKLYHEDKRKKLPGHRERRGYRGDGGHRRGAEGEGRSGRRRGGRRREGIERGGR